jgi:hypothetical protein
MACGILYIIEKLLERRCLKWARLAHLSIRNLGYGQKKGWELKCQFDSRPQRVESTSSRCPIGECNTALESSQRGLNICFGLHCDSRSACNGMGLERPGSLIWRDFETPTRESREKLTIRM